MRTMGGIRPSGYVMPPFHQQEPIMDGPMGRNPPTFGGARPGPFSNYPGPPPPIGGPPQRPIPSGILIKNILFLGHEVHKEVTKILQTFKDSPGGPPRPGQVNIV